MNFNRHLFPDPLAGGDGTSHHSSLKSKHQEPDFVNELECRDTSIQYAHTNGHQKKFVSKTNAEGAIRLTSHQKNSKLPQMSTISFFSKCSSSSSETDGEVYNACMDDNDTKPLTFHKSPNDLENKDAKIEKYKFDNNYLAFVESFTNYCEDRTHLVFDGCSFFDDDFFPKGMMLNDYVPINVVCMHVENLELIVPSSSEYCKYAPCGSNLYNFEDCKTFSNWEGIIRDRVIYILSSLQCPQLKSLEIDSIPMDERSSTRFPTDRLSTWQTNISSFISRHSNTLKSIQVNFIRYKCLQTIRPFPNVDERKGTKVSYPRLNELSVTLWDNQVTSSKGSDSEAQSDNETEKNAWIPDWIPDLADQYWISLMRSQVHGKLTKLCWVSAAKLDWNDVFQPILDSNRHRIECLQILETEGIFGSRSKKKDGSTSGIRKGQSNHFITSNMVLSCAAFSQLCKLKSISLRKTNCYLTHLTKLPQELEELSIDDMYIKSTDISNLSSRRKLKILRLGNSVPPEHAEGESDQERFGVDRRVLNDLLHSRSLEELCIWQHCLKLDMSALSNPSVCNLTAVLEKINTYLTSICRSSPKISPSEFCEWNSSQLYHEKRIVKSLESLGGYVDEECVVIHS